MNQLQLKTLLHYNPETGNFTWIAKRKGSKGINKPAGTLTNKGYIDICIDGVKYGAHRLAFLYMLNDCPLFVDHIDTVKSNNVWSNLRPASLRENAFNFKGGENQSKFRNVYYDPRGKKKWFVRITDITGAKISLGYYDTPEEANEVATKARKEHHGDFYYQI